MLNEMKYVYAVHQEKSFTRAAKKLFVSQPALSNMVKRAEKEIGTPIFDRSTIPLTLTRDGEIYIRSIEQIMRTEQNLHTYFNDKQALHAGSLSVGGSSFFCSFILPEFIGRFNAKYPNVAIDLFEGNVRDLRQGLQDQSLDLIIETSVRREDAALTTFFYKMETIILAVPVNASINQRLRAYQISSRDMESGAFAKTETPPVPLERFRDVPFVLLKEGNDLRPRSVAMCREAGFSPKIAILTDQLLTAANISATGVGAVFIRSDLLHYYPIQDRFCFYKLDSALAKREIFFAAKKGRYISSAMRTFLQTAGALGRTPLLGEDDPVQMAQEECFPDMTENLNQ